ncbi:MAG: hypothetical protein FD147_2646 [Chloroflexi bacterium]|nr:MAG: hypothetical protein FD147_2646 [Chloroflexota bacterium]
MTCLNVEAFNYLIAPAIATANGCQLVHTIKPAAYAPKRMSKKSPLSILRGGLWKF